jgi:uncharacterized membrane protein YGL010W
MEDAMSMSQAIKSLADELKDTVFSHFQPKGVPQHFIGAAVIIGFAVVLLMAFLKGLESTLQPKVEKLGGALALQLPFCFEVRSLSGSLVSSAPE